ncbi:GGDEF domain-containing protein [Sphingobium yanoikuyae]|uniref:GGDEF domain-containing protein n=1 Tax=Sphingobium yanoikuyae TaxID=13690 RepID=UPI00123792C6|nr:GGDEF domain-containing protein [Sphingobium yanoikuyae]
MNVVFRHLLALLALLCLVPAPLRAACIVDPMHRAPPLLQNVEADPNRAIDTAQAQLTRTRVGDEAGWLWATIATAELLLDQPDAASQSAQKGLKLLGRNSASPSRSQLLIIAAQTVDTEEQARGGIADLAALRKGMHPGTADDICTLMAIGTLQHVIDTPETATRSITQAYRMSLAPGRERERAWTASLLAAVLRRAGDRQGAQALVDESIALARSTDQPITLSSSLYQRGLMRIDEKDYRGALTLLQEAAAISQRLQGPESAAYMKMGACEASLGLGDIDRAEKLCNEAAGPISRTQSARKIYWLQARVALARDRPKTALALLDRALVDADDIATSTIITDALETRARARARQGDMAGAYADLSAHLARVHTRYDSVLETQTARLRAQLKTDREQAKNAALENNIALANVRNHAQQRLILLLGSASAAILILVGALAWLSRRHQRRLKSLAETDALTGLPNRGAIERRASIGQDGLFTIALLDLDHFKAINDAHGHAAGDRALQIFAHVARATLRSGDVIGRWGGEEFLAIFPDTTPNQAEAILDRLRAELRMADHAISPGHHLNFSAGIGVVSPNDDRASAVIVAIDAALYLAKSMGRGRSVISSPGLAKEACASADHHIGGLPALTKSPRAGRGDACARD